MHRSDRRNIAIIAHVDHGKTTLVDGLLRSTDAVEARKVMPDRAMDRMDIERERGITILAKNTAVTYVSSGREDADGATADGAPVTINIVDTPGHSDFGGEVERVLGMVDSVLLLVDAYEGPMPQTRFVLRKALSHGLAPIVVINKTDRPDARPDAVLDEVFDLFVALEADEHQLDFPVVYASAKERWAVHELSDERTSLVPILDAIVEHCPPPVADPEGPMQFQCATIDYNDFVGRIAVGRLHRGRIRKGDPIVCIDAAGEPRPGKVVKLIGYAGLSEVELDVADAGDIVGVAGITDVLPGETLCPKEHQDPLPPIAVDEPTVSIELRPNDGPLSGNDGTFVTSRELRERLDREIQSNVSLRVEAGSSPEAFKVSGRGELHLCVLIETMRREGYELTMSMPQVLLREDPDTGKLSEPYEDVSVEVDEPFAGAVIQSLNERGGELLDMQTSEGGITRLRYKSPSRGLIGFRNNFLTQTRGTGTLYHTLAEYGPWRGPMRRRGTGAMVAMAQGRVTSYALETLQERGQLFVEPGDHVYAGQVVGEAARPIELPCNPTKPRKLDNMRASTKEIVVRLDVARKFTLEDALEFIADDELVEVTPTAIRLRKRMLDENERKRMKKREKQGAA